MTGKNWKCPSCGSTFYFLDRPPMTCAKCGKHDAPPKADNGGPAFPLVNRDYQEAYGGAPGMTLRDYFASDAPVSLHHAIAVEYQADMPHMNAAERAQVFETLARLRYEYADAMLKERAR